MKDRYYINRTCCNCGNKEEVSVSKREAVFELVAIDDRVGKKCKKCASSTFASSFEKPDLDSDLLGEWAKNIDLQLMPQDEELLLAEGMYLDDILDILDNVPIPDQKRNSLMEALCVMVYDNSVGDDERNNEALKNRVINELKNRAGKLNQADSFIRDYIKEMVYPQLELKEE